jgi:carboxyl-terminal processing protease
LPEEAIFVAPAGPRTYLGPTVVLTSDVTMSAAEVLTLSLTAFPHVLHMGQSTRGGFSDVLVKTLPNGWRLTLSNEIYLTPDGRPVEGVGLEPASPLQVFPADRVWRNRLNVVREAASVLETRATPALYDTATGAPDV